MKKVFLLCLLFVWFLPSPATSEEVKQDEVAEFKSRLNGLYQQTALFGGVEFMPDGFQLTAAKQGKLEKFVNDAVEFYKDFSGNSKIKIKEFTLDIKWPPGLSVTFEMGEE